MGMTREEAFEILQLHPGAEKEEIRTSYKRLALLWHPDKHENPAEATKKFQEISCAYKKLSADEDEEEEEIVMTEFDMFELFKMMFYANGGFFAFNDFESPLDIDDEIYSADDDYSGSDDFFDDDVDDDDELANAANRLHANYQSRWGVQKSAFEILNQRSEEEARRNAEELLKQEETEKQEAQRKEERRKAKNKRKKEAKKKKKKNKEGGVASLASAVTSSAAKSKPAKSNSSKKESSTTEAVKEEEEEEEEGLNQDEVDDWVLSSAFVRGRKSTKTSVPVDSSKGKAGLARNSPDAAVVTVGQASTTTNEMNQEEVSSNVTQARHFAMRGNEMAQLGHFQAAVDLFSEAIQLHAGDQRYYGNRSFCFDRLLQHHSALKDADMAIKLAPEWPKGYFRRGRALSGLKRWKDAEESFEVVLALDPSCSDALVEMKLVQARQLQEMGFSHEQAMFALNKYKTVPASLDALLSGAVAEQNLFEETYMSDDDFSSAPTGPLLPEQLQLPDPDCGVCSLWVGSVNPTVVKQKDLEQLFGQYGIVTSVKILPQRKCAFVNFLDSRAAAAAMHTLQGYFIGNANLVLRYPNSAASGSTEKKQPARSNETQAVNGDGGWGAAASSDQGWASTAAGSVSKGWSDSRTGWGGETGFGAHASNAPPRAQSGRGSGHGGFKAAPSARAARIVTRKTASNSYGEQECVYWRAKGCAFGDKCRNLHIPQHKGIDLKTPSRGRR